MDISAALRSALVRQWDAGVAKSQKPGKRRESWKGFRTRTTIVRNEIETNALTKLLWLLSVVFRHFSSRSLWPLPPKSKLTSLLKPSPTQASRFAKS